MIISNKNLEEKLSMILKLIEKYDYDFYDATETILDKYEDEIFVERFEEYLKTLKPNLKNKLIEILKEQGYVS